MAHGCIHLQRLQGRHLGFVAGQAAGAAAQKSEGAREEVGFNGWQTGIVHLSSAVLPSTSCSAQATTSRRTLMGPSAGAVQWAAHLDSRSSRATTSTAVARTS